MAGLEGDNPAFSGVIVSSLERGEVGKGKGAGTSTATVEVDAAGLTAWMYGLKLGATAVLRSSGGGASRRILILLARRLLKPIILPPSSIKTRS